MFTQLDSIMQSWTCQCIFLKCSLLSWVFLQLCVKKTSYENIQQIMINGECSPDTAVGEAGFSGHEK